MTPVITLMEMNARSIYEVVRTEAQLSDPFQTMGNYVITMMTIGREGGSRPTNLGTKIWHFSILVHFALFFVFFQRKTSRNKLLWPSLNDLNASKTVFQAFFNLFQHKNFENSEFFQGAKFWYPDLSRATHLPSLWLEELCIEVLW